MQSYVNLRPKKAQLPWTKLFFQKHINTILKYLLAPFTVQNLKKNHQIVLSNENYLLALFSVQNLIKTLTADQEL